MTSAVPLSFRLAAALDLAVSGKPGAAYLPMALGAQLKGDTKFWLPAALHHPAAL